MNTVIIPQNILTIHDNQEIIIKNKPKGILPFRKIGNGMKDTIDLIGVMCHLSKPAQQLLHKLIKGMIYNYETQRIEIEVPYKAKSNAEKIQLKRAYKELSQLQLVLRTKRMHYVVNPYAVITDNPEHFIVWKKALEKYDTAHS